MLSTETEGELAMNRGNTGTTYTHTQGTGERYQGGGRQSQWRANPQTFTQRRMQTIAVGDLKRQER